MKRITTNDDIRFPIRVVKGLDSDIFTIQFYTTSKAVNITKTNEDVVDGIIHLEWTELYPLGTGVMNYTVLIPEEDGSYSDDTFNKSISGTTIFYIVSNIVVPDGDEVQDLVNIVSDLQTQVSSNTAKIADLIKVTVNSSNWSATALQTPNTRYIINGNLDFETATEVEVGNNCQIEFTKGSTLGSNVELKINNAEIVAPHTQIFNGTKITGFFHNAQIPVEWFGAKGDGETDDAEAINTTIKYAGKSEVLLSAPIYVIGSTININETNANFDTYEGQVEAVRSEEGGKKFLCKGSIYSTSDFTGYTVGNVTVPAMVRLAASNATVRIEGAIVVHADLTDCIGFLHEGYHDNKVYIARVMKARDYIGVWSWLDGTNTYTNQALMNLGTCDGVVYIYAMGGDFECEQICGFNNGFMVSDKYATVYAGVQQASFKFASLTANYGIRVKVGNNDGLIHPTTAGWMNACRIEYNGISGSNESRRFIPNTDATFIKVDSGTTGDHFCQNKIICNSVEPVWYKLMDINRGRGDYFEYLGNFGDCHIIPYINGIPDDKNLGESAPTECYNGLYPYTSTNKYINISNSKDFLINNLTPFYPMPYDTIYVHNSSNIVFTNCQSAEYLKDNWYQYVDSARRFEKVIFTCSDITDLTSTVITIFEPDSRETDTIAYVENENEIDLTVDRLNIVTTPAYTTKFNSYPLYQVIEGVKSQLGYCYDYKGLIASNNTLEEALSHVTVDAYTKAETNTLLAGKANKNGSASETFTTNGLNLTREGASTTLYNYKDSSDREYVSFYDKTGGSLTYQFTANQGDNIATERQLNTKANSADVYSKTETYTKSEVENLIDEHVPELPDNVVTDANYVHTDNNFTTALKNKLDGLDGKQVTYVNVSVKSSQATFTDLDGNTLTLQQSLDLLRNKEKDLVLIYLDNYFNLVNFTDEDNFLDITFAAATNSGNGGFNFLNLSYYYEPGSEDTYITASSTVNYIPNSLNHLGSGYFNTNGSSTTAITATTASPFSYTTGGILIGHFSVDVGANATLNISAKGAKSIYYQEAAIQAGVIKKGDNALFQFYNNRFNLICTDHPASGGGVQSDWNETDTTSLAYIQNKPTIPDLTANTNVLTGTSMRFFDGIDNYVTLAGDYDSDLDANTLRITDLYSGNSVLFSMAPGGYRLNIGDQRTNITAMPAAVDGVSTVVLAPGYNLLPLRIWRTAQVKFEIPEANHHNVVTPEYYIYIPKNGTATHSTTSITFDGSKVSSYLKLYWKGGTAPDIIGNATNYQIIKLILISDTVALGEQYIYS
jgi:hypothetical protein